MCFILINFTGCEGVDQYDIYSVAPSIEQSKKPAILAQTGTTSGVSMSARPLPQSKKPSINLEQARKRAAARERKLKQQLKERLLEEEKEKVKEDEDDNEDRVESETSSASVR